MQLRFATQLTGQQYVEQKAWLSANLERCPLHPGGGCHFSRHTPYERVEPPGTFIARWYCPEGKTTFSLLPDFLASRLSSTLEEVEAVAGAVEDSEKSFEQQAPGLGLIRFSIQELRRLMVRLALAVRPTVEFILHWSRWRRRHQAIAKLFHYRRRAPKAKVPL